MIRPEENSMSLVMIRIKLTLLVTSGMLDERFFDFEKNHLSGVL